MRSLGPADTDSRLSQKISGAKYTDMEKMIGRCSDKNQSTGEQFSDGCLAAPYFTLICFNCGFVLIATALCAAFALEAKGSGIPEIKCFLNGIKRRGWLNLRTMIVKVLGVLFSVSATMPVGKEGPMIHSGAIVGAGLPQLKSTQFGFDFKLNSFRSDHHKRDFTAAGAAAGVSAAFGAPLGGVLFSLEEGASHWNQALTWRTLLTAVMALFVLRIFLSGTADSKSPSATSGWGRVASTGLVDFGVSSGPLLDLSRPVLSCTRSQVFDYTNKPLWTIVDIPIFVLMGIVGGIMGAGWCAVQKRITILRMRLKLSLRGQMLEAVTLCAVNTTLFYLAAMGLGKCEKVPIPANTTGVVESFNGNWLRVSLRLSCVVDKGSLFKLLVSSGRHNSDLLLQHSEQRVQRHGDPVL